MRKPQMDRWADHCGTYFCQDPQTECTVLHPTNRRTLHIDMLLFKPNEKYPFYKLCTMGASDYKLPLTACPRNEFVMFLPAQEDVTDKDTLTWYCDVLLSVVLYPAENHFTVSFGHSIVWGEQPGTDMQGAFLDLPYPIAGSGFSVCRLGPFKKTNCLQVTLLSKEELDLLLKGGPEPFYDYLYPEAGEARFLSRRFLSPAP